MTITRMMLLVLSVFCLIIPSSLFANDSSWPRWDYDLARTHYYPYGSNTPVSFADFVPHWSVSLSTIVTLTGDITGDGFLEVIGYDGSSISVFDKDGNALWNVIPAGEATGSTLLADVTGDGVFEVLQGTRAAGLMRIFVYDGSGALINTISRTGSAYYSTMWPWHAMDFDSDGSIELLVGLSNSPYGVSLLDYPTGVELWHYNVGSNTGPGPLGDIDGDGDFDLSTYSWPTSPIAVDAATGVSVFTPSLGCGCCVARPLIFDGDHDGYNNLLFFLGRASCPGQLQLHLLDASGSIVNTWNGPYGKDVGSIWAAADLDGDMHNEIVLAYYTHEPTWRNHTLVILEDDLTGPIAENNTLVYTDNGNSVSLFVTDLNGDGTNDILVTDKSNGKLHVLDKTLSEVWSYDFPNINSMALSDLNDDGIPEIILSGDELVVLSTSGTGGGGTQCSPLYTFTGVAYNELGWSVSGTGDFNADGYDDIIVGLPGPNKAYLYSGQTGVLMCEFTSEGGNDDFGISLSDAGDINNDGYGDVIVGAYVNDVGGIDAGRAYVFFGGSGPYPYIKSAADADLIITGESPHVILGYSVSGVGDVNNDGYDDFVVGAPAVGAGKAYVYSGPSATLLITITGEANGDALGSAVSGAGDYNNDGYADIIVGAVHNSNSNGTEAGRAYLFLGGSGSYPYETVAVGADIIFTGEAPVDRFGRGLSCAGDVNHDGYDDVIIGGTLNDAGGNDAGRAYVFFGDDGSFSYEKLAVNADWIITAEEGSRELGISVSAAGDINGDCFADILVGAPGGEGILGHAYVFYGGSFSLPHHVSASAADMKFSGEGSSDKFGISVSDAGDVNNDGSNDLIVGAGYYPYGAGGPRPGRAYVYDCVTNVPQNIGDLSGLIIESASGLLGVPVDLYDSDNIFVSSTVTGELGEYQFTSLADGVYTVSISTPLGYQADEENKEVSIPCSPVSANFELTELEIIPQQRSRGYWKHQVSHVIKNIEHGDDKPTDYSAEDFMGFLALTESHFVLNQINPVTIYDGSTAGNMLDSLKLLKELLCAKKYNDDDISKKLRKGKAELMALILNVVSGKISQTEVISEDGANVSQAVTYSWMLLNDEITCTDEEGEADEDADEDECNCNYKIAEKILKKINHGKMVKANVIPLDIQFIAYKQGLTPSSFSISQNYPNPFNPTTEIMFSLPEVSDVTLVIYNVNGQKVATLISGKEYEVGYHSVEWDAGDYASGLYFYRIQAGEFVETKKMMLLK